jgi:hypothetical protein
MNISAIDNKHCEILQNREPRVGESRRWQMGNGASVQRVELQLEQDQANE